MALPVPVRRRPACRTARFAFTFVDHQQNRRVKRTILSFLLMPSQEIGDFVIGGSWSLLAIGDQKHQVCVFHRHQCLTANGFDIVCRACRKGGLSTMLWINAAGIHHIKPAPVPLTASDQAIPRRPRCTVHNGQLLTDQAVEKGAFAHIGATNQCNEGFACAHGVGVTCGVMIT